MTPPFVFPGNFSRWHPQPNIWPPASAFANFDKATELKKRLWFTLGALILFRLLSFVPVPGIDPAAMSALYQTQSGGILDVFNTFSGGALERFSIVALGVMPYITASIVVQLGGTLYGPWQALRKEGETGRKKLNQYTRYLTVAITLVQGYLAVNGLESQSVKQGIQAVVEPGLLFEIAGTVSLVGGTLFLMWIGEQITSRGIGNGVSLIIMAGIIARLPQGIAQLLEGSRTGSLSGLLVVGIVVLDHRPRPLHLLHGAGAAAGADPISEAADRARNAAGALAPADQAQHRRRHPADLRLVAAADAADGAQVGRQPAPTEGGASDWLITISTFLQHGSPALHGALRRSASPSSRFFYTAVQFNSEETAENLKRHGGFIPGIRPGKATENYFDYLLNRITVVGAAYLVLICLIPEIAARRRPACTFQLGGTSLLIVVNVTMDTVSQIQSHLIAHQYGDLIKKAKLKTTPRRR